MPVRKHFSACTALSTEKLDTQKQAQIGTGLKKTAGDPKSVVFDVIIDSDLLIY